MAGEPDGESGGAMHEMALQGFRLGRMAERDGNGDEMEAALAVSLQAALSYSVERTERFRSQSQTETADRLLRKRFLRG